MATWGGWSAESGSGNRGRLGYDQWIEYSGTQARVRVDLYLQTRYTASDSSNSLSASGLTGVPGGVSFSLGADGVVLIGTFYSGWVERVYGAPVGGSWSVSLSGVNAWGGAAGVGASWSATALPFDPPVAPGTPSVARSSDAQQNLSWSRNATTGAPYVSQTVSRAEWSGADWGAWVQVSSHLAGTATSYSDTTTAPDRRYRYRVWAYNESGLAASGVSASVDTTPAAPLYCSAEKNAAGDVVVTVGRGAGFSVQTEVEHQPGGGAWELLATLAAGQGGQAVHTHTAPSTAVTHLYRARHKSISPVLTSGYAVSGLVQLLAQPNKPTVTGPAGAQDAASALVLTWVHNPADGTPQSASQVRYRLVGAPSWTTQGVVSDAVQSRTFAPGTFTNGTSVEFQVVTKGAHATASEWSNSLVVAFSAAPTVMVAAPSGTVATPTITVGWGYYQAQGQAQERAEVELRASGGAVVEARTLVGAGTSQALATVLPDGSAWLVLVRVRSTSGQWSAWDSSLIGVDYPEPAAPVVSATWLPETGSVAISITNPDDGGLAVVRNSVERSIDGGAWVLVATDVAPGGSVVDTTSAVMGASTYRVTAYSALPSAATTVVDLHIDAGADDSLWLSRGPGYGAVGRAHRSIALSYDVGPAEQAEQLYAGRDHLVAAESTALAETATVRFSVLPPLLGLTPEDQPLTWWLAWARIGGPVLLRDARTGVRLIGSTSGITVERDRDGVHRISLTLRKTRSAP